MSILRTDKIAGLESVNAITGSVKFSSGNGANQGTYLEVYDPDRDFNLGTTDFSIEFWMYPNTTDTSGQENDLASLFDYGYDTSGNTQGAWFAVHQDDRTLHLGFNNANQVQTSNFLNANTWHHIAIQKHGGFTRIYGDGTQVASVADTHDYTDALFRTLQIGSQAATGVERSFDGYISCVRICKGHVIYKKAFTPPTRQLTVHDGPSDNKTVLFCCHSSQDPLREETGKDIVIGTKSGTPGPVATTFTPDVGNDHTHGTVLEGGTAFNSLNYLTLPRGTTTQSNRGRGLFGGGYYEPGAGSANLKSIEYFNIQSTGNSIDFGDRTIVGHGLATLSSSTRGVMMGGRAYHYPSAPSVPQTNIIDYVTIATTANAQDFGDMVDGSSYIFAAASNATRGIISKGGATDMSYVTIATLGNSVDTGGDSTIARNTFTGFASPTRAIFAGGGSPSAINTINYVTITSLGDAINFGDLTFTGHCQGASSETRGIIFTGGFPSAASNVINFITMASAGDATDFGDLPANITSHSAGSGVSNSIRAVRCAGYVAPAATNRIDYVTIATTGNASDFGDVTVARYSGSGFSDSHGGLS